jgi:hypothetical protein
LLARLLLGGTTQLERLVLALEDDLLLLGMRLGDDALAVVLGVLDRAGGDEAARDEADHDADDGGHCGGHHDDHDGFRHSAPPLDGARLWAVSRPLARAHRSVDHLGETCPEVASVAQRPGRLRRALRRRRCAP